MTTQELTLPTMLKDNGDGGFTAYVYKDKIQRLKEVNSRCKDWGEPTLTEKELENENFDTYKLGYPGSTTIKLKVDKNGKTALLEQFSIHGGQ